MGKKRRRNATDHDQLVADYGMMQPRIQEFARRIELLILQLIKKHSIPHHTTESRAKSIESFAEKIQRPGKSYTNPLDELPDLAGARVILYYQEDVDEVTKILRNEFEVDDARSIDKSSELDADQFGYLSVHLVVSLNDARAKLPEWDAFVGLVCEIQVRTVLQHAWAAISHHLQYKRESDVPSKFRRRLMRLAGLFELADDEFTSLKAQQESLAKEVSEQLADKTLKIEINAISIEQYCEEASIVRDVMDAVSKSKLKAARAQPDSEDLLAACKATEISTLGELDAVLRKSVPRAKEVFEMFADSHKHAMGDVDHWCAVLVLAAHQDERTMERFSRWDRDYRRDVLKVGRAVYQNS